MKLLVFILLISSTIFSQEYEVITERFYEYKYNINKTIITTNEYSVDSDVAFEHFQNGDYIQITTDTGINWYLSDTLTKLFLKGKKIKDKFVMGRLGYMVNNLTIDSTSNLFYREIESNCYNCLYSIQNMLLSDSSLIEKFNGEGVNKIVVIYVQLKHIKTFGYIYVEVHKRFRRPEQFLYVEDMD